MSALLTFLGGAAFRGIWGEISDAWKKHQDHKHELAMMQAQAVIDAQHHRQQQDAMRLQAELGVKTIQVQAEADIGEQEAKAWATAVKMATMPTGVAWLDIMRGMVQPVLAYIAILLWVAALNSQGWNVTEWDKELISAIFGMYLANRQLTSRGK